MKNISITDVRNFAFLGHTGSGKTTLADALLFKLGVNDRLGSPADGTSMCDYSDEEKSHGITISMKSFMSAYTASTGKTMETIFHDSPGYMDFFGGAISAARAADTGVVVIDASSGIQVGTHRAWKCCASRGLDSRAIVITGLDKDNTDFEKILAEIQSTFGAACIPAVLPLPGMRGVVDVLSASDVPAELAERVSEIKGGLVELAAETDEALIEKYFEVGDLTPDDLGRGLVEAFRTGAFVPVFVTVAAQDIGITEFLDGACRLFPCPECHEHVDSEGDEIKTATDAPFVGLVYRSVNDKFVGKLSFVRVLGGTLTPDTEIYNASRDVKEKVSALLNVNGKKQTPVLRATAGDVVAIPKLKDTHVGNTLCAVGTKVTCPEIRFPTPVMFQAVTAATQKDEDKMAVALQRLCEEDPTLHVVRNDETHEQILQGLGDMHIKVAVEIMQSHSNVSVELHTPKVPYRETITANGEGRYKHKKQSGGRGQYGEAYLRVEPLLEGDEEAFVNAIVGGAIPGNFIAAVQKGLADGMQRGAVSGFPVKQVKVTLYDGSYHDVDSSEVAFKIAGSRALRAAMADAKPVLLEPIMKVKVLIPDDCMGDVNGDLNQKRGRILGMGVEDGMQVIEADVPQSELFGYSAELRSITGGRGSFEMAYSRYDVVPSNVAQRVIAEHKVEEEED
jgi:elongation factor G